MAGSTYGKLFRVTTWGESHGEGIGVVVDGCPAGLALSEEAVQTFLNRRKPGSNPYATPRKESDTIHILSGVFEGMTTGTPISLLVQNESQRSGDYENIRSCYRPGHADYTMDCKYGFRDYRGGGRTSGRETIGRVAAGAVASLVLEQLGIQVNAYASEIGGIAITTGRENPRRALESPVCMPDEDATAAVQKLLTEAIQEHDSVGGIIECQVRGLMPGIGEPVFDKLDARLSQALCSIGAVKGVEIGDGFHAARAFGSTNNDAFMNSDGFVTKKSNHAGGILGGMSDGDTVVVRAAVKPTPSIFREQDTVNCNGEEVRISIQGRHDPIIVPRAVVVVEAMTAITLVDLIFENMSATMTGLQKFYIH